MATPKKKKTGADGKVPCPPDLREEAGFEPQAPDCELPHTMPPTPEEVMRGDYPTLNGNIPELLKAILRELIIMRLSK